MHVTTAVLMSMLQLLENGDLLIRGLDFVTHMGVYKCEASNSAGRDIVTTFVYPVSRFSIPSIHFGAIGRSVASLSGCSCIHGRKADQSYSVTTLCWPCAVGFFL